MKKTIRQTLFAGLTILIPLYLTIYVLDMFIRSADRIVEILPQSLRPPEFFLFPGSGLFYSFVIALVAGFVVRNYIGKSIITFLEGWVDHIPLVKSIYRLFRQISETFLSEDSKGFRSVVMVQWPGQGLWTVAFVTGEPIREVKESLGSDWNDSINLFVPTTPNPTSGFYFVVKKSDTRPLNLSIETAFKLIISGGALNPPTVKSAKR